MYKKHLKLNYFQHTNQKTKMISKNLMHLNYKSKVFYISIRRISSTEFWCKKEIIFRKLHSLNASRLENGECSTTSNIKENNSSIDINVLNHYNTLDKIWWDKNGLLKGLHTLNTFRVPFIKQCLEDRGLLKPQYINTPTPLKDLNILDSGCGGGILSEALTTMGANVTGIDITPNLIKVAKEHSKENPVLKEKLKYVCAPLENISHQYKNKFDVVISSEILDHVASKEIYLKSLVDVLKPNGSLILSAVNKTLRAWYIYVAYAEYISKRLPKGGHHWKKLVRPEEVQKILADNKCKIIKTKGFTSCLGYTTKFEDWYWSDDLKVHYFVHAIKK